MITQEEITALTKKVVEREIKIYPVTETLFDQIELGLPIFERKRSLTICRLSAKFNNLEFKVWDFSKKNGKLDKKDAPIRGESIAYCKALRELLDDIRNYVPA